MRGLPEISHEILDELIDRIEHNQVDQYIVQWYRITRYKEKLGFKSVAPYCRQFRSSRQYEDASDLSWQSLSREDFIRINLCIERLALSDFSAIQREMRNRFVGKKVWRYKIDSSYEDAIDHVLPFMREKGLIE